MEIAITSPIKTTNFKVSFFVLLLLSAFGLAFAFHYEDSTDTPSEIISDTDIDWAEPSCNPVMI